MLLEVVNNVVDPKAVDGAVERLGAVWIPTVRILGGAGLIVSRKPCNSSQVHTSANDVAETQAGRPKIPWWWRPGRRSSPGVSGPG